MDLYCFFHLNMAFSSIEEEARPEVVRRCYWPILHMVERLQIRIGIEASGYTLKTIAAIDPAWIEAFGRQVRLGRFELIGSGLTQMIGPLVPAAVTEANLRLGNAVYEDLLGHRPRVALVAEQAFSSGLVPLYREAGFEAVITEWNNAAQANPEWPRHWRYYPQRASGTDGEIPVIWNESIAFQKFQRFVHGESELDEYCAYLDGHAEAVGAGGAFPVYGSDAEVFDYRPGRFATEPRFRGEGEWDRMEGLLKHLQDQGREFVFPSDVIGQLARPEAGHLLTLGSAAQPVPVKKQGKYNLLRWAVTGRDDLAINTRCWNIYSALIGSGETNDADWAELCQLWSSDFRTHITDARWGRFLERLGRAEARFGLSSGTPPAGDSGSA
jgi:glycosyl hydrolase family 57